MECGLNSDTDRSDFSVLGGRSFISAEKPSDPHSGDRGQLSGSIFQGHDEETDVHQAQATDRQEEDARAGPGIGERLFTWDGLVHSF
jgi:hypothetical protein